MIKQPILFAADGTLFDATDLHYQSLNSALKQHNLPTIKLVDHLKYFNGLPTSVKLNMLTHVKAIPEELHDSIKKVKQAFTLELIPKTIKPLDNILDTLEFLKGRGHPLAICSNAKFMTVKAMAEVSSCIQYFDFILGNEHVKHSKPNPEIFHVASEIYGVPLSECIIVEDSIVGIKAAEAAKPFKVIQVKSPYHVNKEIFNI